jgi:hypothetical protein
VRLIFEDSSHRLIKQPWNGFANVLLYISGVELVVVVEEEKEWETEGEMMLQLLLLL